ncbi:unnamed protein product [Sphagnum balticum]
MWGWRLRSSLIHLRTKSLSWQEQTRFLAIQKDAGFEEQKEAEVEEKGQVCETWTWGKGEDGQLGLGKEDTERLPSLIESLQLPVLSNFTRSPMPGVLRYPESASLKDPASWTASSSSSHEEKSGDDFMGIRTAMRYLSTDAHANIPREAHSNEVGIACGLFHSCLWENGNLWVWGKGDGGRLGLGGEDSMYSPVLNPNIAGVKMVALGGLHSAAVTEDGSVYTWGFGGFGALGLGTFERVLEPKQVELLSLDMQKMVHIAAGGAHTAAVSESGDIFTWGRDAGEGRLGHVPSPEYEEGVPIPVKLKKITEPMGAVNCGGFFTMALTLEGQLWSWGGNSNYELGRGDQRSSWKPRPVPAVEKTHLLQVACGGFHTAALTEDGKVLTWGHGRHGQLGHGDLNSAKVPTLVKALEHHRVVFVACGSSWTAAVTESGNLFTWGKNRDCQLGIPGLLDTEMLPVPVVLYPDIHQNPKLPRHAVGVACGANHGMGLINRH